MKSESSKGHGEKRSRKEEQFCAALLLHDTVAAAAAAVGISPATATRWLADPEFDARYRAARQEALRQAQNRQMLTREWVLTRLAQHAERALAHSPDSRAGAVANRALELLGRELGMFRDPTELDLTKLNERQLGDLLEHLRQATTHLPYDDRLLEIGGDYPDQPCQAPCNSDEPAGTAQEPQ